MIPLENSASLNRLTSAVTAEPPYLPEADVTAAELREGQRDEVLAFLAVRPLHTVIMADMIRNHGVQSPLNRGTFYACRNAAGERTVIELSKGGRRRHGASITGCVASPPIVTARF